MLRERLHGLALPTAIIMIEIFDYIKILNGIVRKIMKTYNLQFYNFKFTVLLTIDWILLLYYENISYSLKKKLISILLLLFFLDV